MAKIALESAANAAGGVHDLDKVLREAEKNVKASMKTPQQVSSSSFSSSVSSAGAQAKELMFPNYKTKICTNHAKDKRCPNGEPCNFAHGKTELRNAEVWCICSICITM